jgi:hypothetical protein
MIYTCSVHERQGRLDTVEVFIFKSSLKKYLCGLVNNSNKDMIVISKKLKWFGLGKSSLLFTSMIDRGETLEDIYSSNSLHHNVFILKNRMALLSAIRNFK